jgi:hypothetical protein
MNVNVWGPELWGILHGLSSLGKQSTANYAKEILVSLKTLLPCIHCRNSYIDFYAKLPEPSKSFSIREEAIKWVYVLHNKVNDKLDEQLAENSSGKEELKEILKKKRPTLEVVKKRLELSFGNEISENAVIKVLFSFALQIDKCHEAAEALIKFCSNLSMFLNESRFEKLRNHLEILSRTLSTQNSSQQALYSIVLVTRNLMTKKEEFQRLKNLFAKDLEEEWNRALRTLPASGCGNKSCK